jgi:hypothetical protein
MSGYKDRRKRTYQAEWATFTSKNINAPCGLSAAKNLINEYLPGWTLAKSKREHLALCYSDEHRIVLGKSSPLWIVCHEIAHGLVEERNLPIGHHEVFRQYYIDVCRDSMGPYWGSKLSRSFEAAGLDFCYPGEQPRTMMQTIFSWIR